LGWHPAAGAGTGEKGALLAPGRKRKGAVEAGARPRVGGRGPFAAAHVPEG